MKKAQQKDDCIPLLGNVFVLIYRYLYSLNIPFLFSHFYFARTYAIIAMQKKISNMAWQQGLICGQFLVSTDYTALLSVGDMGA